MYTESFTHVYKEPYRMFTAPVYNREKLKRM